MAKDSISERTPLLQAQQPIPESDLEQAYGFKSHATFSKTDHTDEVCLTDYEPLKLSSFRVCSIISGTIFGSPLLWIEQSLLCLLFLASAFPIYYFFHTDVGEISARRFVLNQESKMRAFAMIVTTLAFMLLSFYTGTIVARWWAMRTAGVGGIKAATVDLTSLIYQSVTQDRDVLNAVQRYGRASLMLIFLWRRKQLGRVEEILGPDGMEMLTKKECEALGAGGKWNKHCLHETIWAWQAAIVNKLNYEGKIQSDQVYGLLLNKVMDGRAAVQCIHTHVAVRVPMQYVHLLGLLVKMHNVILAVIMGILFGASWCEGRWILCVQLCARLFILPLLFNAILLVNCDLSDPFDGNECDFPGAVYSGALEKDCNGVMSATENVPEILKANKPHTA
jgi:hypothetical protein